VLNNLIGGFIIAGIPVNNFIGEEVMPAWGMTVCGLLVIAMVVNALPKIVAEPVRIEPVLV